MLTNKSRKDKLDFVHFFAAVFLGKVRRFIYFCRKLIVQCRLATAKRNKDSIFPRKTVQKNVQSREKSKNMDIGLKKEECKTICTILNKTLATTYAIYLKTQFFHWNVTGKEFYALHVMFQKHYEELAEAIDEIAERVRSLGENPPGSFSAFAKLSDIQEETTPPSSESMLKKLTTDHETLICYLRKHLPQVEKLEDGATADLINKRLATHEKAAWMLRTSI